VRYLIALGQFINGENHMKTKCLAIGIILLFVSVTIAPVIAQNTEKSLPDSKGNWLYVGGSGPGNYSRIQDAVNNASNWDTVFVFDDSSPYFENIDITKSIVLMGELRDTTIIDANNSAYCIRLRANNVTISGFTLQNGDDGITLNGGNNMVYTSCTIMHNIITNNECGILIIYSYYNLVEDNIIKDNIEGIVEVDSVYETLKENTVMNNTRGIGLCYSNYCEISRNIIENNTEYGLILDISLYNKIFHNNFIQNSVHASFGYLLLYKIFSVVLGRILQLNKFYRNYWDDSTFLHGYKINGIMLWTKGFGYYGESMESDWYNFDWFPALRPYNI